MSIKKVGNYRLDFSTSFLYEQYKQLPNSITCKAYSQMNAQQFIGVQIDRRSVDANQEYSNYLTRRINYFRSFDNPNLLKVKEFQLSRNNYTIIHELYYSDLENLVKKKKPTLIQAIKIITDIIKGINSFVEIGITHGTLSTKTVFIMKDGSAKVGGFYDVKMRKLIEGSFCNFFSAKETLEKGKTSEKSDVWALGCILYSLIHPNLVEQMKKTSGSSFALRSEQKLVIDSKLDEKVKDFLKKTIVSKESDRLSWVEMLAHPIFNNHFKQSILKFSSQNNIRMLHFPTLGQLIESKSNKQEITMDIIKFTQLMRFFVPQIQQQEVLNCFKQFPIFQQSAVRDIDFNQPLQKIADTCPAVNPESLHPSSPSYLLKKSSKQQHIKKDNQRMMRVTLLFFKFSENLAKSQKSLETIFRQFSEKGKMTKKDLQNLIKKVDKSCENDVDFVFQLIDKDKSGQIDFNEFKQYFHYQTQTYNTKNKTLEEELNKRIRNFFTNLHGKLTARRISFQKLFQSYSKSNDGNMTLLEFTNMINCIQGGFEPDQIRTVFNYINKDGTGTLELNEIYDYYLQVNNLPEKPACKALTPSKI